MGRRGEKIISVQQLLYTAGKRNKRIALASEAAHLTELELLDLLRGLRFDLRSRFYAIYFQQQTLARFDQQIATLQTTVSAYETQYERNNVSLRELLRLKALLFQLSNDRTEILFQLAEDQRGFRTLLAVDQPIPPPRCRRNTDPLPYSCPAGGYPPADGPPEPSRSKSVGIAHPAGRTELYPSAGAGPARSARGRHLRPGWQLHSRIT